MVVLKAMLRLPSLLLGLSGSLVDDLTLCGATYFLTSYEQINIFVSRAHVQASKTIFELFML